MGEQKERMLHGQDYLANDPALIADRLRAALLLERFNQSSAAASDTRRDVLVSLFASFGKESEIVPPLHCDYGYLTTIGKRTFINCGAVLLDVAPLWIGDDVQIGPNVQLLGALHPLDAARRRARWESGRPITIHDGAWLGGGVIVLPGVAIGPDAVVGAGSVVVHDVPPATLVVGNPARVIRTLP